MSTPSKPLLPTILTTALVTALAVGGFYHVRSVAHYQSTITDLNAQIAKQAAEQARQIEDDKFIQEFLAKLEASGPAAPDGQKSPDSWIYGAASARFTLVEMTDTECPYCKQHFPLLKSMIEASGGHVNAALLHVPAHGEASRSQAVAIECAGEQGGSDAAWKFAGEVFDSTKTNGGGVQKSLASIATGLGLDGKRFSACTESTEANERVRSDLEQVLTLGIQQTPSTLVLDNTTGQSIVLQGSNASTEGIMDAIESMTKGAAE